MGLQGTSKAKKEADAKPAAAPMDPGLFMVKLQENRTVACDHPDQTSSWYLGNGDVPACGGLAAMWPWKEPLAWEQHWPHVMRLLQWLHFFLRNSGDEGGGMVLGIHSTDARQ